MEEKKKRNRAPTPLNEKTADFAQKIFETGSVRGAAVAIGVPSNTGDRLAKRPEVKKAVAEIRTAVIQKIAYTAETAMREAEDAIKFARETENASAMVKAVELRSKLMGLLVDKIDIRAAVGFKINIKGIDPLPPQEPAPVDVAHSEPLASEEPSAQDDEDWDPFAE